MPDAPSQAGPYQLLEPLDQEGQASTYRAAGPQGLALVRLLSPRLLEDPAALARFQRDAQALSHLSHPNLLQVLASGQEGGHPYLALEFFEGIPLDRLLRQRRLSVQEAFTAFRGICRGLAHAHQHGVVHRYLKPRDVLVSPDLSEVKLADFGLGRMDNLGTTATLNTGAVILGSLPYLAPEVVEKKAGAPEPDHRADLYSAGVILHEMLTGRPPSARFALPSQVNTELPSEIDVLVMKCLARNPLQRYATALDLLADLTRLEETLRLRVMSEIREIAQAGSQLGKKQPWVLWAGLLLLIAALAVAGLVLL